MAKSEPFIKLGKDGENAPVLSYNLPEPTTYSCNSFFQIPIPIDKIQHVFHVPSMPALESIITLEVLNLIKHIIDYGKQSLPQSRQTDVDVVSNFSKNLIEVSKFIILPQNFEGFAKIKEQMMGFPINMNRMVREGKTDLFYFEKYKKLLPFISDPEYPIHINKKIQEGFIFCIHETFGGVLNYKYIPIRTIQPQLMIVEKYKLSNFLGNYGAGKTIKTFSLLPGEKNENNCKNL